MQFTKKRIFTFVAALGLGASIGTGAALAAIPDSGTGVLTACRITGDAGNVRIIDKQGGASCHSYETELSWDTTPPVPGREIVTDTFSAVTSNNGISGGSVNCPSGKKPLGGGYSVPTGSWGGGTSGSNIAAWSSYPFDGSPSGWTVNVKNMGGSALTVTVYAVCATD